MHYLLYFIDIISFVSLTLIWIFLLCITGLIKDIGKTFKIVFRRKEEYSMIELKRASMALDTAIISLYLTGAFLVFVKAIMMLHRLDDTASLGPFIASVFLVIFYGILLNIVLFPFKIKINKLIISFMDENETEYINSEVDLAQRIFYRLKSHGLTDREAEVARLVSNGISNKEIAKELYISETTVKKHLTHIFEKMNLDNRDSLTKFIKEI